MKMLFLSMLLINFLFAQENTIMKRNDKLIIGIGPWVEPKTLIESYKPLVKYLQKNLNIEVEFLVTKDYSQLGRRILDKSVDIGLFSPVSYVEAKKRNPSLIYLATTLRTNDVGKLIDYYSSYIITHKDSKDKKLEDFEGKKFAFTDFSSSSGYVYPSIYLKQQNIKPREFFSQVLMLKKHSKVCEAIARKKIDLGATYDDAFNSSNIKFNNSLVILAESGKIPFDALAAGDHVDKDIIKRISILLLEYKGKKDIVNGVSIPEGFAIRDDKFYDIVREAIIAAK